MRIDPTQPVAGPTEITPLPQRPSGDGAGRAELSPNSGTVQMAVDKLNQVVPTDLRASFQVAGDAHMMVVQLVDTQTGEVKRQFPPEWVVETAAHIAQALGVLLDKRA